MFLLFLSNSISKGYLGNNHRYIKYIINNHFNWFSLTKIPKLKALYIVLIYISNGHLYNVLNYIRNRMI